MRKRTVNHVADTIFWYLLYFLPVIGYLLYLLAEPSSCTTLISITDFFSSIGLGFVVDNPILSAMQSIFGTGGILPFFTDNSALFIFTWFICCYICHLFVDFILFIPRLAHKWMSTFTKDDE